jgi:hypothetical protein
LPVLSAPEAFQVKVSDDLRQFFGDYLSEKNDEDWEGLKSVLRPGESVSGKVVARYRFGVFVDLCVGFPALLEVIQFERARVFRYTSLDTYPAVGSKVRATVVWFDDGERQIKLTQLPQPCTPDSGTRKRSSRHPLFTLEGEFQTSTIHVGGGNPGA